MPQEKTVFFSVQNIEINDDHFFITMDHHMAGGFTVVDTDFVSVSKVIQ